jgi:autotransporter-associated beta strand protein
MQVVFNFGSGGGTLDVPSGLTLTIDDGATAGNAQNAAQLQGTGTLTKIGDGTLTLGFSTSNFSAFTGAIVVDAGTLQTGTTGFDRAVWEHERGYDDQQRSYIKYERRQYRCGAADS